MTTSSSRQNSRFSSLKVFKFAPAKPPPLPPKDPYYLHNPSLPSLGHSLSPDTPGSQPVTPLSAQYAGLIRSPSPSPSYAPSRVTMSPSTSSSTLSPESAGFRKGLQKLTSFSKRPRTPKSPELGRTGDMQPPEPADDPSISLPWNFQVCDPLQPYLIQAELSLPSTTCMSMKGTHSSSLPPTTLTLPQLRRPPAHLVCAPHGPWLQ